ncbi:MAG: SDR family oxidoreductase [Bacteroidota bacterium]
MKRILICGSNGLLGQRLALMLEGHTEYEVLHTSRNRSFVFDHRLFDYTQLDIARKGDVKSLVSSFHPHVILNAAGATNVDWCESHREEAWAVNVVGVEHLIEAARKVGAHLVNVSTDYVFDGKAGPYSEDDRVHPISYYGKTKLAGENALRSSGIPYAICRTIVLYGSAIGANTCFPLWVVNSLKKQLRIRCVTDQISNPTYVADLALAMVRIMELGRQGVFHICGSERISRYDFALRAAEIFGCDTSLIDPITSAELSQAAPRPLVTGFITLKAEAELGYKPMNATQGLTLLKRELHIMQGN